MTTPFETERGGEVLNVTDALFAIADSISTLARAVDKLGMNGAVGDKGTEFGALEVLSMEIKDGLNNVSQGFYNGCEEIAQALRQVTHD